MSADHAVFPIEPCEFRKRNIEPCRPPTYSQPVRMCVGCLGDGRRVLLDQGVPVELIAPHLTKHGAQIPASWVEVS